MKYIMQKHNQTPRAHGLPYNAYAVGKILITTHSHHPSHDVTFTTPASCQNYVNKKLKDAREMTSSCKLFNFLIIQLAYMTWRMLDLYA